MPSTEEIEDIWLLATSTPPPSASPPPSLLWPPASPSVSVPLNTSLHSPFVQTFQPVLSPYASLLPLADRPYVAGTPPSSYLPPASPSVPWNTTLHPPFVQPFQPLLSHDASLLPLADHLFVAGTPPSLNLPPASPSVPQHPSMHLPINPPVQPPPPTSLLHVPLTNHPNFEENAEGGDGAVLISEGSNKDVLGGAEDVFGGAEIPEGGDGDVFGDGDMFGDREVLGDSRTRCWHACCVAASDALNCEACLDCGQPKPPASVAETVARMRMQLHVADHEDDVLTRPHGGPSLRRFVSPSLLFEFERVNGKLEAFKENGAPGAPMGNERVLVWAHVVGFPAWPALAPATWRTATAQVTVIFLGMEGQTGKVSVTNIHPLGAHELKALEPETVSTKWRDKFECARMEAVELQAAAAQFGESAQQQQQALRQHAANDTKPVVIRCSCCSRRFFFDFIWELCYRMELHEGWYSIEPWPQQLDRKLDSY